MPWRKGTFYVTLQAWVTLVFLSVQILVLSHLTFSGAFWLKWLSTDNSPSVLLQILHWKKTLISPQKTSLSSCYALFCFRVTKKQVRGKSDWFPLKLWGQWKKNSVGYNCSIVCKGQAQISKVPSEPPKDCVAVINITDIVAWNSCFMLQWTKNSFLSHCFQSFCVWDVPGLL